jgi:hypothetical protein
VLIAVKILQMVCSPPPVTGASRAGFPTESTEPFLTSYYGCDPFGVGSPFREALSPSVRLDSFAPPPGLEPGTY